MCSCIQIFVQYPCLIESEMVLSDNTFPPIFIPDNDRKTKELKICLVYGEQGESMYLAFQYQYFAFILFLRTTISVVNESQCKWSLLLNLYMLSLPSTILLLSHLQTLHVSHSEECIVSYNFSSTPIHIKNLYLYVLFPS